MSPKPTVFVIEPDPSVRDSICAVATALELRNEAFTNGEQFLAAFDPLRPGCLVLEIRVPGVNGLQIQQKLVEARAVLPLIFLASSASVSIAVHVMRAGALHFLEKPFHEHDLWSAIQEAVEIDHRRRQAKQRQDEVDLRLGLLSEKEYAVLELLADCKNKRVIAEELGVSVRTVEHHRTQLMRKLKTNSIAGLLQFAVSATHNGYHHPQHAKPHEGNGARHATSMAAGNGAGNGHSPHASAARRTSK